MLIKVIRIVLVRVIQNMDPSKVLLNIESYENGEKFFGADRLDEKGKHFFILKDCGEVLNFTKPDTGGIDSVPFLVKYD